MDHTLIVRAASCIHSVLSLGPWNMVDVGQGGQIFLSEKSLRSQTKSFFFCFNSFYMHIYRHDKDNLLDLIPWVDKSKFDLK